MENINILESSDVIFHDKYDKVLILLAIIGFIITLTIYCVTYVKLHNKKKYKKHCFILELLVFLTILAISLSSIAISLSDINIRHTGVVQYKIELKGSSTEEELSEYYYWKKIYGNKYWIIEKDKGITEEEWKRKY